MQISEEDIGKYYRTHCGIIVQISYVDQFDEAFPVSTRVCLNPSGYRHGSLATIDDSEALTYTLSGNYYVGDINKLDLASEVTDNETLALLALEGK